MTKWGRRKKDLPVIFHIYLGISILDNLCDKKGKKIIYKEDDTRVILEDYKHTLYVMLVSRAIRAILALMRIVDAINLFWRESKFPQN